MARLLSFSAFAFLFVTCVTGCGSSTTPTVSPPPAVAEVKESAPTVTKGYDGTVKPPTQEEIDAHNQDAAGN